MYTALILLFLGLAGFLVARGLKRGSNLYVAAGILTAVGVLFLFSLMSVWGEYLWFESLGYENRFWKALGAEATFAGVGALFGGVLVALLTVPIGPDRRRARGYAVAVAGVFGALWGLGNWETILKYLNRVPTGVRDPLFGRETGFYLFALPFYDSLYTLLMLLALVVLAVGALAAFVRIERGEVRISGDAREAPGQTEKRLRPVLTGVAAVLVVFAYGKVLDCFHLMYSEWGAVTGPGWTDVHVRLPAYLLVSLLCLLLAAVLAVPPIVRRIVGSLTKRNLAPEAAHLALLGGAAGVLAVVWFLSLQVAPGVLQWLRVEPNEITLERPYIERNIRFTRHGYKLHEVEEREFVASETLTREMVEENESIFSNIRLWDWRALDAVYRQFQEIRLYYEFVDVDIDRYTLGDTYRQVMVSAREMEVDNLPAQSQTFVNRRFKYTHGNGITLTTVHDFTSEGLPNLLVKDIPPRSEQPDLEVEQPRIYYGELTREHVLVNTREKEFDYPRGEKNAYVRYGGDGGVQMKGLWRKFLFGWKFDGTRLFLSGYPTEESRIQFHRQVRERVETLAPFLHVDDDPYIVLAGGRLYWIVDAYTTSDAYPYSEPFSSGETLAYKATKRRRPRKGLAMPARFSGLGTMNYIRNSVKGVVDAYNGTVRLYVYDEEDPIVRVWRKIFPDLFLDKEEMPSVLRAHVRYPANMLLIQGLAYAKYHMTDPAVFYNQEDLWIRATEKYYQAVQPVEPYYVIWELPGSDEPEFVLILPFTPKNRQVLIGWIAGMCDPGDYGRLLAYKFPKEKRVLGPQQVETKIDQDRFLSGQLTLWDQRGSNVIRGNVLAIPIGDTLLYVEPIYLQAETAAYPELRLVAVMHGDTLSYAESFDKALEGLFGETPEKGAVLAPEEGRAVSLREYAGRANEAFEAYLRHLGEKNFQEASRSLEALQSALRGLSEYAGPGPSNENVQ